MKKTIVIIALVLAVAALLYGIWFVWITPKADPIQPEDNGQSIIEQSSTESSAEQEAPPEEESSSGDPEFSTSEEDEGEKIAYSAEGEQAPDISENDENVVPARESEIEEAPNFEEETSEESSEVEIPDTPVEYDPLDPNTWTPGVPPGFDPDEIIVHPKGSGGQESSAEPDYLPGVPHDAHIGSF